MRQPLRPKANQRQQISAVYSMSAPTGGWNARDSIAAMDPLDAVKLVNFFPTTTDVELRGGSEAYATGITGLVETLAVYNRLTGTNKLFAVDENDVWDISSAGAASAQSTTVSTGRWQWTNFGDGTNNYLIMVNGADAPLYYNGSAWTVITGVSTPALSGVTLSDLVHVNEYKGRLFFIQKSSLSFWYLAAGAAGGALTEFDLSSFAGRGGYLMWMATWSFDAGDGPDDAAVFMTSEGEVIVYRGTDPSTAADWVLTGIFHIGKPLGRRSFVKFGGDLIAITQNGAFPISKALSTADINYQLALTNKIEQEFTREAQTHGSLFGWQAVLYPLQSALIFNIPHAEGGTHEQYVMNTITGAWCEFDEWDAECFVEYNNELYFGVDTAVHKAWTGTSDLGSNIVAIGKTAFNYFGNASQQKRFNLFRPMLRVNGNVSFLTGMDVDFSDTTPMGLTVISGVVGAKWDVDYWDLAYWAAGLETTRQWTSPFNNVGYAASGVIQTETNDVEIHWVANDYVYEHGGIL